MLQIFVDFLEDPSQADIVYDGPDKQTVLPLLLYRAMVFFA